MAKNRNKDGKTGQKKIKYGKKEPTVRQSVRETDAPQMRQTDITDPFAFVQTQPADLGAIDPGAPIRLHIKTFSPLHLGTGYADIHVDADVVQDAVGLPYFPAKRLKGLLYESGCEVAEMAETAELDLFDKAALDALFQRGRMGAVQLILHNLYMEQYEEIHADLKYLEAKYPSIFRPEDVLGICANLRWQTKINRETGIAEQTTLHNMRVIEKGAEFSGEIRLVNADIEHLCILALAVRNLSQCGGKRTRGFGRIGCTLRQNGKDIAPALVTKALGRQNRKGGRR